MMSLLAVNQWRMQHEKTPFNAREIELGEPENVVTMNVAISKFVENEEKC
jgi:hypothetical protein